MRAFKIGCLTNTYMLWPWEKALRSMASLGCTVAEVCCDRPHLYPGDLDQKGRDAIRALLRSISMRITTLEAMHVSALIPQVARPNPHAGSLAALDRSGPEPMFTSEPESWRKARVDFTKRCIDLAAELGAENVDTYSGGVRIDPDTALKYALEGLEECVAYAARKGINLLLELSSTSNIIGTPQEVLDAMKVIRSPFLGVSLDVGHVHMDGFDIHRVVDQFGDRIKQVHLADIRLRKHYHLIPGRGDVDFKAALDALDSISYKGSLVLELYPYCEDPEPAVREGLRYIRTIMERG
jgi:fructoselysine 3-epimerase